MPTVGNTLTYKWGDTGVNSEFVFQRDSIADIKEENKLQKISKSPYEIFPISFNFINNLGALEVILSYTSACINIDTGASSKATIIKSDSISAGSTAVAVVVQSGTLLDRHKISVTATTNFGNVLEYDCILNIVDDITSVFKKQSTERKIIQNDFTPVLQVGDTINTFTVTSTKVSDGSSATVTTSPLKSSPYILVAAIDGTAGEKYHIRIRIVTTATYQYEKSIIMDVENI